MTVPARKRDTKKRGNGQGTVWEEKNGRWRWQVTLGFKPDGGRITRSGTEKDRTTANRALARAITDYDRGVLTAPDAITVAQYAERWLVRQGDLRLRTVKLYRVELSYALEHLGRLKVRDVKRGQVEDLMAALPARVMGARRGPEGTSLPPRGEPKTMSVRTTGKVLTRLRSLFRDAVADGIMHKDPTAGVRRPKGPPSVALGVTLDFHEAARFHEFGWTLHEAGLCRMFPALFTSVSVGLRRGEVMGLRWQDVDLEKALLRVRQARTTDDGEVIETGTKTFRSSRDIPMPSSLVAALRAHRDSQTLEREWAGESWLATGAVFATQLGNWIHPSHLGAALSAVVAWSDPARLDARRKSFRRISGQSFRRLEAVVTAGEALPYLSPHDLRHTAATLMLRRGVPVEVVSKILGHAKISITLDIYRHVLEAEKRSALVDLFDVPLPVRDAGSLAVA